jgi:hypothetical protein
MSDDQETPPALRLLQDEPGLQQFPPEVLDRLSEAAASADGRELLSWFLSLPLNEQKRIRRDEWKRRVGTAEAVRLNMPPFQHDWHTIELQGPFIEPDERGNPTPFVKILRDGEELEQGMLWFEDEDEEETVERAKWIVDRQLGKK